MPRNKSPRPKHNGPAPELPPVTSAAEWRRRAAALTPAERARDEAAAAAALERAWPQIVGPLALAFLLAAPDPGDRRTAAELLTERISREERNKRISREVSKGSAVCLAAGEARTQQPVRIGKDWLTDPTGHIEPLIPAEDLTLAGLWKWFAQQVAAAADAELRNEPYPTTREDALNAGGVKAPEDVTAQPRAPAPVTIDDIPDRHDPLGYLLTSETMASLIRLLASGLPKRQREAVHLVLIEGNTRNQVAARLRISRSTVDNTFRAVDKKIKNILQAE